MLVNHIKTCSRWTKIDKKNLKREKKCELLEAQLEQNCKLDDIDTNIDWVKKLQKKELKRLTKMKNKKIKKIIKLIKEIKELDDKIYWEWDYDTWDLPFDIRESKFKNPK